MFRCFTSYSLFHPHELRSTCLKVAVVLGLAFLLPVALMCQKVEREYKITRYKSSGRSHQRQFTRRMYVFIKLSGLSDFSDFLLSSSCHRGVHKIRYEQDRSTPLPAAS